MKYGTVTPNGMKVLAALGLADRLVPRATTISTYAFRNDRGAALATTRIDPSLLGQPMLALSRTLLFETLAEEMRASDIDVHYEKRLAHLEERSDCVVAHFDDGSSAVGDVVIGADGVRSAVRAHLLPGVSADFTGLIGVGGFTTAAALPRDTMTFVFGRQGFFGYSSADRGSAMWWSNLFRDREFTREDLALNTDTLKGELLERFGGYSSPVPELISRTTNVLRLNVYDVRSLPIWHRSRIVLIGDAAHAVSPNAGQGAALALEDAMYLARLLRDTSYEIAFERFERDRKPRAEMVVAEGRRRGVDKAIVGRLQQAMREVMIRLFVPLFGGRFDRRLYEYQIEW